MVGERVVKYRSMIADRSLMVEEDDLVRCALEVDHFSPARPLFRKGEKKQ